jgi:cytochrome c peroxidase
MQFQTVFQSAVTQEAIAKALAAFVRTLVPGDSALDRYLKGEKKALSREAREGMELFVGSAGCVRCHHGALLSDGKYYRVGVGFRDEGRSLVTGKTEDKFKFRTPSLRDVARTAPYMHDGSKKTLFAVVEFYFRGVPPHGPDGLELDVGPLVGQSYSDIQAVVAFLESLSGKPPDVTPPEIP